MSLGQNDALGFPKKGGIYQTATLNGYASRDNLAVSWLAYNFDRSDTWITNVSDSSESCFVPWTSPNAPVNRFNGFLITAPGIYFIESSGLIRAGNTTYDLVALNAEYHGSGKRFISRSTFAASFLMYISGTIVAKGGEIVYLEADADLNDTFNPIFRITKIG